MSKEDGGPAFPCGEATMDGRPWCGESYGGMSLRDYFAGLALQGLVVSPRPLLGEDTEGDLNLYATIAYDFADRMLQER